MCGENSVERIPLACPLGSSPRMRGKRQTLHQTLTRNRLIPAYAGKTSINLYSFPRSRAHPRVCGENGSNLAAGIGGAGSSPRMRGKLLMNGGHVKRIGLIPAYAGKTLIRAVNMFTPATHPRVCGENAFCIASSSGITGSSPRMRGKRTAQRRALSNLRLIPAYAGKTFTGALKPFSYWAHPRVCGENQVTMLLAPHTPGSSPRMRGKHLQEECREG